MDAELLTQLLKEHPAAIAKVAREHLTAADRHYHDLLDAAPEDGSLGEQEAYYAAVVATAISILTYAPNDDARLRVQSVADILLKMHDVPFDDTTLKAEIAESLEDQDVDLDVLRNVIQRIVVPEPTDG